MTDTQIRVEQIEFAEDGSTVVTFAASGGGLADDARIRDTVTPDELAEENNANDRAAKAVHKAQRRLSETFFKLYHDVDPDHAHQRNEQATEVDVRQDDRHVRLASMKRADDGAVNVAFHIDTGHGTFTLDLAVGQLNATLGPSRMTDQVHPDRVVVSARSTLAKVLVQMSDTLGSGQARI